MRRNKTVKVEIEFDPRKYMENRKRPRRCGGDLLAHARSLAIRHARAHSLRLCTLDDVRAELARSGLSGTDLGGNAGNVFRTRDWEATSWRVRSARPNGRRRLIRIWRFVGERVARWVEDPQ